MEREGNGNGKECLEVHVFVEVWWRRKTVGGEPFGKRRILDFLINDWCIT